VGWRTRSPAHLEALVDRLRNDGLELTEVTGVEPGQGPAFRFRTPGGLPYELYFEVEKRPPADAPAIKTNPGRVWGHGISPRRIDHVNFVVAAVAAERAWSQTALGFRTHEFVSDEAGGVRAAWLSVTALAHDLALGTSTSGAPGLHHVAYALDNASDVLRAAEIYAEHGLEPDHGPGRHAISQAVCLYVRDPGSGNRLELYTGAYLVLDPDWEPVEWKASEYRQWWGPEPRPGDDSPIGVVTPC
jgi:catechol 2,3-dioxygenase